MSATPPYYEQLGFQRPPFGVTVGSQQPWINPAMKQHLRRLEMAATADKGVLLVVGEVGLGKSTLAHLFQERLEELACQTVLCTLLQDPTPADWLMERCLTLLQLPSTQGPLAAQLVALGQYLDRMPIDHPLFILLDEAQRLITPEGLALLRALATLQSSHHRRCCLVLFGLPSLYTALQSDKALAQRVGLKLVLEPLSAQDAMTYIQYRLQSAGGSPQLFSTKILELLVSYSGAVPRVINTLGDGLLMEMALTGQRTLSVEQFYLVAQQLGYRLQQSPTGPIPQIFSSAHGLPHVSATQSPANLSVQIGSPSSPLVVKQEDTLHTMLADIPTIDEHGLAPKAAAIQPALDSASMEEEAMGFDPMALAAGIAQESVANMVFTAPLPSAEDLASPMPPSIAVDSPLPPLQGSSFRERSKPEEFAEKPHALNPPGPYVPSPPSVQQAEGELNPRVGQKSGNSTLTARLIPAQPRTRKPYDADLDELEALLTTLPKRPGAKTP